MWGFFGFSLLLSIIGGFLYSFQIEPQLYVGIIIWEIGFIGLEFSTGGTGIWLVGIQNPLIWGVILNEELNNGQILTDTRLILTTCLLIVPAIILWVRSLIQLIECSFKPPELPPPPRYEDVV